MAAFLRLQEPGWLLPHPSHQTTQRFSYLQPLRGLFGLRTLSADLHQPTSALRGLVGLRSIPSSLRLKAAQA